MLLLSINCSLYWSVGTHSDQGSLQPGPPRPTVLRETSLSPDGDDPDGLGPGWGKCTELGTLRGGTSSRLRFQGRFSG